MIACEKCGSLYEAGDVCSKCKDREDRKAFLLFDPVFADLCAEYQRRYGRIWLDS